MSLTLVCLFTFLSKTGTADLKKKTTTVEIQSEKYTMKRE